MIFQWLKPLLVVLAVALAYFPATHCGFIWDDDDYVTQNLELRDADGLRRIWLAPSATPQYYPLVHSSFWLEYQSWGLDPRGYHVTNIVIHTINAFLLWWLLVRLRVPGAWLAAMVFAVHPVHVESVAWVTERKNVLSGMFYLLAILAFIKHWDFTKPASDDSQATSSRGWRLAWLFVAYLCFIAALLSKTVTATLPAALLVLVWWKQGRLPIKQSLSVLPMILIGAMFGWFTVWLEKVQVGASGLDWNLSFVDRWLVAGRALWFYARKLLWPSNLIFTYPRWDIDSGQWWQYLFPLAAFATIFALWWYRQRIGRGPLAAVLLFAGSLFPALGFFDVYPMRFSYVADHFQYLASIAVTTLLVATLTTLITNDDGQESGVFRIVGLVWVGVLMALTWNQTKIYEGLEPLWRDTLAKNPSSFMAHNNLGALLNRRGDYVEAEVHIRAALRLKPGFVDSMVNMGKAREGQGDLDGAMDYYRQAVELNPSFPAALNGLGAMYGAKGDLRSAEQHFEAATQADPEYPSARMNLATLYLSRNELPAAIEQFETVLKLQPDSATALAALSQAYQAAGQPERAENAIRQQLSARPDDVALLGPLGVLCASQKKHPEAIECFERILELIPDEPNALYYLSQIYTELGDSKKASEYADRLPN